MTFSSKAERREIREDSEVSFVLFQEESISFSRSPYQTSPPISLPGTHLATLGYMEDWGNVVAFTTEENKEEGAGEGLLGLPVNSVCHRYLLEHHSFLISC